MSPVRGRGRRQEGKWGWAALLPLRLPSACLASRPLKPKLLLAADQREAASLPPSLSPSLPSSPIPSVFTVHPWRMQPGGRPHSLSRHSSTCPPSNMATSIPNSSLSGQISAPLPGLWLPRRACLLYILNISIGPDLTQPHTWNLHPTPPQ